MKKGEKRYQSGRRAMSAQWTWPQKVYASKIQVVLLDRNKEF